MLKKLILLLSIMLMSTVLTYSEKNLLLIDENNLVQIKEKIKNKDYFIMPAYEELLIKAEQALKIDRISVVDRKMTPSSNDKHDYMSFGPYWWPNPETKSGYPYIKKDGQVNPEMKDDSDSLRLQNLAKNTEMLALAYYYTSDIKYAEQVAKLVKIWFLDKETKMNPHLKYGQAVPGQLEDKLTSLGILESRQILRILDAVTLIENSNCLNKEDMSKLEKWIKEFNNWLYNDEFCYQERYRPNNHGTYYDYQVGGYFIYLKENEEAEKLLKIAQYTRLASHVGSKGQNFHELERTRPLHYSIFDLEALVGLAIYGDRYNNIDFWNFDINKTGLKKAIDYVLKYKNTPEMWLVKNEKVNFDNFAKILLIATQKYNTNEYKEEIKKLWKENPKNLNYLKWNVNI